MKGASTLAALAGTGRYCNGGKMSASLMGLVVLGGVIYSVATLLAYFGTSSGFTHRLHDIQMRIALAQQRFDECEARIESLEDRMPGQKSRCARLRQWIVLLTEQMVGLETQRAEKASTEEGRQEAIQDAWRESQNRWLGA